MLRTASTLSAFVAVLTLVCGIVFTSSASAQGWKNYGNRSGLYTGPGGGRSTGPGGGRSTGPGGGLSTGPGGGLSTGPGGGLST